MRVHVDCYPCFVHQAILAIRLVNKNEEEQKEFIRTLLPFISEIDISKTPAHTTTVMQRRIREMLNCDPFLSVKREYNKRALTMFSKLRDMVFNSRDPLWTATRLSIAGNIIDFSIFSSVDVEHSIERALNSPLSIDDYPSFREAVNNAENILLLADNAGEIVFDRLLVDILQEGMKRHVVVGVKGGAVINDATIEDAKMAGFLEDHYKVIDNGADAIGTILEVCSDDFRHIFNNSDLIISKGQGNFETLHEIEKEHIFFLFQIKCDVVANVLGKKKGDMLLKKI
ncbi:MAG: DUF89 family protein [Nitrospirae bacterium]|nr:MAG: DUF89 family protein [Nitrospirota bacterium]